MGVLTTSDRTCFVVHTVITKQIHEARKILPHTRVIFKKNMNQKKSFFLLAMIMRFWIHQNEKSDPNPDLSKMAWIRSSA